MMKKTRLYKKARTTVKNILAQFGGVLLIGAEWGTGSFITFHRRPKTVDKIANRPFWKVDLPKIAIVMQGPIVANDNFTRDTLRLYARYFKDALLIFSTWDDVDPDRLREIRLLGVHIVQSRKPEYSGNQNVNFQVVSARAGVEKAKELGAVYCLKTRSDQRFYDARLLEHLYTLSKVFPVSDVSVQAERLIVLDVSKKAASSPYHLIDNMIFGTLKDHMLFWAASLMQVEEEGQMNTKIADPYLFSEFLKKINYPLLWTIEDSFAAYGRHFIIADSSSLDWYWPKYARHEEYRGRRYERPVEGKLSFLDWLVLFERYGKK